MKQLLLSFLIIAVPVIAGAQVFPGITTAHKKQLLATGIKIPLPTYLPKGFSLDTIIVSNTGKTDTGEDRVLFVQYTKKLPDGRFQSFYAEAGFDGLGSLWYKGETLQSPLGKIILYYQPEEETEEGQKPVKVTDLIGTEWFTVAGTEFHVFCIVTATPPFEEEDLEEEEEKDPRIFVPIPKTTFKKILQSLRILK